MCQWTAARRDEMNKRRDAEKAAEMELIALQRKLYGPRAQPQPFTATQARQLVLIAQRDRAMAERQLAETQEELAIKQASRGLEMLARTARTRADAKIVKVGEEMAALAPSPPRFAPRQSHNHEEPRTPQKASAINKTLGGRVAKQTKKSLSPQAPSMKCRPGSITTTQTHIKSEPASPEGSTTPPGSPVATPPGTPPKPAPKQTGTSSSYDFSWLN